MQALGALTTASIVQPLPDLTGALAPQPVSTCDNCSGSFLTSLQCFISDNPLLIAAIAVGAFCLMSGKRRRG